MAEETARLRLPEIVAAQSQKHVTHNDALMMLDTLVMASVIDKDLTAPPGSPTEGDCYIVAGGGGTATGAWAGWEKRIVRYQDGAWRSFLPGGTGNGWFVWVQDELSFYVFFGSTWNIFSGDATGASGAFAFSGDLSPAQITADQNNYNPTGLATASVLRLSSNAARSLTGLSGGGDGRIIIVSNVGSFAIALRTENASSSAANRFGFDDDLILRPKESAAIQYDATLQRWISLTPTRRWTLHPPITASDSAWPIPVGTREIIAEAWGGGGSGSPYSNVPSFRGTGAGAGGYAMKHYKGVMDATLNIAIGAGGASTNTAGTAGNNGGNTTVVGTNFGTLAANGGNGGAAGVNSGGAGGTASGGDVNIRGQAGKDNTQFNGAGVAGGGSSPRGGFGGTANVGSPGDFPGGGGAGANYSPPDSPSGAGANGMVLIWTR